MATHMPEDRPNAPRSETLWVIAAVLAAALLGVVALVGYRGTSGPSQRASR